MRNVHNAIITFTAASLYHKLHSIPLRIHFNPT